MMPMLTVTGGSSFSVILLVFLLFFLKCDFLSSFLLFIKVSKVGTGLEEIKVKSDVAIPDVAHSALPFLLLVESDVEE